MLFTPLSLAGAFVIDPERKHDERGFFAATWTPDAAARHGLAQCAVECNISFNTARGTLRGMHFQRAPHAQAKLVRCTAGAIYDVLLDLRPESSTYKQSVGFELSADNRRMLYIPEGCAHGFQTLTDNAELFYQMSSVFVAAAGDGVRWNDSAFGIEWPFERPTIIAPRDAAYPDFAG